MATPRTPRTDDGFAGLGLTPVLLEAITALGYEEPTPVQRATIPPMLAGRDLLAQAATGTGKTAAFALPMIQRLTGSEPSPAARRLQARSLVLVPTRELAMQVSEAIHKYARGSGTSVVPLYGGSSMEQQIRALRRGVDVVVATPGRALDHIRRQTFVLDGIEVVVLDEADEMLDMGFADDIDAILERTPATRQTTLFSATLPARILKIAERHLNKPERLKVAGEKTAVGKMPRVRQVAYIVRRDQKARALDRVLDMEDPASAIVFCRTRLEVDTLMETLNAHGYRAEALHGGMMQRQRDAVMGRVRARQTDLLIATDVAARGLDIEHVSHVVNYDLPAEAESYIHRIGRTGRAGREGTAISFAEPREHRLLKNIEQLTRQRIEIATVPTVADLRSRRLELTKASLRERLVAGDFDDVRVVVESLSDEFDVMDIAAAAVKLAHAASASDTDEEEIEAPTAGKAGKLRGRGEPRSGERGDRAGRRSHAADDGPRVRLFIGAGRRDGIRPGDIVGAITGEAGIGSEALGAIQITDGFSLVEVPELLADAIIAAMKGSSLRGKKAVVRRDRDRPSGER
jgi:ATP-dependent RNA helicase DeaD